ncbi:putative acyl-coenzyme A thioesterase THEM4-like isoform 2 [Scophthalmus maximus]|uniref:Acyl-coenzyme A thioesterase THEM4 n=1 Tax=Scophthalmus maximus TaxID=52904 RepID=A0A2U9AYB7_SCOMX|nr:putative acyl-coenzyme A thioesterase THEM4-like isoform 2 [Scophthalmus maximus]
MTRGLGGLFRGVQSLTSLPATRAGLGHPSACVSLRTMVALPSFLSFEPRDFSLPNSSWSSEMLRLYEQYSIQCEVETEGGENRGGQWQRLPSYNRSLNHVHGGATATMIDTVTGSLAALLSGPVMTANLNINYRSAIPLGSTVLIETSLDSEEGRKKFISCKVTSTDGSKLHTEATALFLSINISHLLQGG